VGGSKPVNGSRSNTERRGDHKNVIKKIYESEYRYKGRRSITGGRETYRQTKRTRHSSLRHRKSRGRKG